MESTNQTLLHYGVKGKEFELQHYGVKGMKWGRRRKRNVLGAPGGVKGGPYGENKTPFGAKTGPYGENKTPAIARSTRDAANQQRAKRQAEKKQFKADVKDFKKNGFDIDYEIDVNTGQFKVTEYYNSKKVKLGKEYAERVLAQARKDNARATLGATAAVLGASIVAGILAEMG